ncbi:MAG TPA: hypothetical protein PKL85_04535 [Bacteroidia bacterium]|nr:hypothetical protein [Bacteroidia bacterium]
MVPRSAKCCVKARARGHSVAEVGGDTFIELALEVPWRNEPSHNPAHNIPPSN